MKLPAIAVVGTGLTLGFAVSGAGAETCFIKEQVPVPCHLTAPSTQQYAAPVYRAERGYYDDRGHYDNGDYYDDNDYYVDSDDYYDNGHYYPYRRYHHRRIYGGYAPFYGGYAPFYGGPFLGGPFGYGYGYGPSVTFGFGFGGGYGGYWGY